MFCICENAILNGQIMLRILLLQFTVLEKMFFWLILQKDLAEHTAKLQKQTGGYKININRSVDYLTCWPTSSSYYPIYIVCVHNKYYLEVLTGMQSGINMGVNELILTQISN